MKTLNMKLSLHTYNLLADSAQLNPKFVSGCLTEIYTDKFITTSELPELHKPTVVYALKINDDIHHHFKRLALDYNTTLSDLTGRLFEHYYTSEG